MLNATYSTLLKELRDAEACFLHLDGNPYRADLKLLGDVGAPTLSLLRNLRAEDRVNELSAFTLIRAYANLSAIVMQEQGGRGRVADIARQFGKSFLKLDETLAYYGLPVVLFMRVLGILRGTSFLSGVGTPTVVNAFSSYVEEAGERFVLHSDVESHLARLAFVTTELDTLTSSHGLVVDCLVSGWKLGQQMMQQARRKYRALDYDLAVLMEVRNLPPEYLVTVPFVSSMSEDNALPEEQQRQIARVVEALADNEAEAARFFEAIYKLGLEQEPETWQLK